MKFKDLEIGQTFRWVMGGSASVCTKTGPGLYECGNACMALSKRAREASVIPESEPPSAIAAAERDTRWYLLNDMEVKAADVKALRDREGIGVYEGARMLKRQKLQQGLDGLRNALVSGEEADKVLHDLIEIVRELV